MINFNGAAALETPEFMIERLDEFGGPDSYNHYAVGWAHAMDTPYQWTKQVASHFGGTRNGTIVHWPDGITARGEIRTQFAHVIDVAPTVLEAAGLAEPTFVNGVQQTPMQGVSMRYSFDDATARRAPRDAVLRDVRQPRHLPQGLDRGDAAQDARGSSSASRCRRSTTTSGSSTTPARTGRSPTTSSAQQPERLHQLQRLFLIEATRNNVLPLDDRVAERILPDRGRPADARQGQPPAAVRRHGPAVGELDRVSIKNKSHAVTAEIDVPEGGAQGVIIAQGGSIGGWSLYVKDGRLRYCYNLLGVQRFYVEQRPGAPGRHAPGADGVRLRRPRGSARAAP